MPYPVQVTPSPGTGLSYVITKDGRVWLFDGSTVAGAPSLDISDLVLNKGEQGLLSIAVHELDSTRVFLHYTANDGDTVVAEYQFQNGALDPDSAQVLLRLGQPASNHNGGMIQLGTDGRLYVGLGDGGGSNDQFNNGQNLDSLLGGLVAIDIDTGQTELFSSGLRNPWRFWIEDDDVYIADVGQNKFEEVSVSPLAQGTNYGWPITEGLHCFRPSSGCDVGGQTLPLVEVAHGDAGTCSITGGLVYRGEMIPEITGHYFYSDYCGGYLRSFIVESDAVVEEVDWTGQVGVPGRIVGFGVDARGEMYVMTPSTLFRVVGIRD